MPLLPRGPHRRALRSAHVLIVVAVATVLLLAGAGAASGHAAFVASQPAPGSTLAAAPGVVTLRFTEPLIADLSSATVIAPTGEEFTGRPVGDDVIRVEVTSTAQGEYTVEWKTVSPLDGHTLRGSFQFGVGTDVGPQADRSDAPAAGDLAIAVGRTVEYVGLLAALGWLSLAALARGTGVDWVPTGLRRWVLLAAGGGVATVVGELLLASGGAAPAARAFLAAGSGPPRLGRLIVELVAVLLVVREVARRGDVAVSRRSTRVGTALLLLAALLLLSAAGHAAARGWPAILANAGHLAAAGVWAGTILVMASQRPGDGWTSGTGRQVLAAFPPIAAAAFGATVLLGTIRGVQELTGLHDLWQTGYGATLSLKVLLVGLMVPLSVRAWRDRSPRPRHEAVLALGVVVVAAMLAAYPVTPGRGDAGIAAGEDETDGAAGLPRSGDVTLAGDAGATVVGVTIRPGTPGTNEVDVYLVPRDGPEEAGELEVTIAVEGAGPAEVRRCGVACRRATVNLVGGDQLEVEITGEGGGVATVGLPELPALDGRELLEAVDERMAQLDTFAYDEVFGPHQPPTSSSWRVVAPDRLHGVITRGDDYRETVRIADRRWNRDDPDGPWSGGEPGTLTVTANRFIWDQEGRTAIHVIGTDVIDGVDTRVLSFFVEVSGLPIWYRLWVDDDHLVRQAQMRTQGHFMDHRYHRFDDELEIRAPS